MRHRSASIIAVFLAIGSVPHAAVADVIRNACLKSERGTNQVRLCTCLQQTADRTLSRRDQRQVSEFFADPEEAERVRRSDTRRNEAFWDRYEVFGDTAAKFCKS